MSLVDRLARRGTYEQLGLDFPRVEWRALGRIVVRAPSRRRPKGVRVNVLRALEEALLVSRRCTVDDARRLLGATRLRVQLRSVGR